MMFARALRFAERSGYKGKLPVREKMVSEKGS
jgi:hypothetical protein